MKVAVISANYASYDPPKAVCRQDGVEVEWTLLTDDPHLLAPGWRVLIEPIPHLHPNRAAKRPKLRPWAYTDAIASIWLDASFTITSSAFVSDVLDLTSGLACFTHPERDCIYEEATAAMPATYAGEPIAEQITHYRPEHPEHWGLWATGCLVRHHTPGVRQMCDTWGEEIARWSRQDQLSFPVALRRHEIWPDRLPGEYFANSWITLEPHA